MQTIPLQCRIIYGPVSSRRLGQSLGLNISPLSYKFCSFDCIYCQYGWTAVHSLDTTSRFEDFPTPKAFSRALETALQENKEIDNITFSGNGEPTLHPQFEELVDIAKEMREKYKPQTRLGILSNSSTVNVDKVSRALAKLDFRIMKLDTGDPGTFGKINRPCQAVSYETIVYGLKSLEDIILQTMFVAGEIQNIGNHQIEEWIQRVDEIQPLKSQIYSLHRPPACSSLQEVARERLQKIAYQTQKITGVPVEVIVASSPYWTIY